ncbi:MAG TPA: DUF2934 domain-containing protein [Acidobacteriaceae bacterium]|nr:DUF2934 domain-containing protein [Acidobacteriaceae bacterium]
MAEKKAKAPAAPRKAAAKKQSTEPKAAPAELRSVPAQSRSVSHDDIRQLAHRFWAERGHPHGQPEVDWFRAEQELRGKAS